MVTAQTMQQYPLSSLHTSQIDPASSLARSSPASASSSSSSELSLLLSTRGCDVVGPRDSAPDPARGRDNGRDSAPDPARGRDNGRDSAPDPERGRDVARVEDLIPSAAATPVGVVMPLEGVS